MAYDKDSLRRLVSLQQKDKGLDSIQVEIDAVAPKIAAVKSDLESERRRLDAAKTHAIELEKKKKTRELDVAAKEDAARKHATQLNEVKSNDAYKALQAEINKEKAAAGEIETDILQIMEEIDAARAEEKAAAAEYKKTEEFAKKDIERLDAELSHARGRHATAKSERDAEAATVSPDIIRVYEHIRGRGKPDAAVPVIDGHCGGCQINLSPSAQIDLAKMKSLVVCESCQRILYKPEQVAAAAA